MRTMFISVHNEGLTLQPEVEEEKIMTVTLYGAGWKWLQQVAHVSLLPEVVCQGETGSQTRSFPG